MTHHRIDELDAIVTGRIMTRGDHHTDSLAIQFPRAQGCQQPNAIDNRVKQRAESIIS